MATNNKLDESKVSFRKSGSDIFFQSRAMIGNTLLISVVKQG